MNALVLAFMALSLGGSEPISHVSVDMPVLATARLEPAPIAEIEVAADERLCQEATGEFVLDIPFSWATEDPNAPSLRDEPALLRLLEARHRHRDPRPRPRSTPPGALWFVLLDLRRDGTTPEAFEDEANAPPPR